MKSMDRCGMRVLSLLVIAVALASCGKSNDVPGKKIEKTKFEQPVAEEARELVTPQCPTSGGRDERPADFASPNIRGLTLGTGLDSAIAYLQCLEQPSRYYVDIQENTFHIDYSDHSLPGNNVRTYVQLSTGTPNKMTPHDRATMLSGSQAPAEVTMFDEISLQYQLWSIGDRGKESVVQILMNQYFKKGENPTAESVIGDLEKKYGRPNFVKKEKHRTLLAWSQGHDGRSIVTNDELAACRPIANSWSGVCGLSLGAEIVNTDTNELLANRIEVILTNQADLIRLLKETQQRWKSESVARKEIEASKASNNKPSTKL